MIRFAKLLCLIWFTTVSVVMADTLDVAKIDQSSISLTTHLGILEDANQILTLDDVQTEGIQFQTGLPASKSINLSYSRSAFWLRLNLDNSSDQFIEKVFEINQPLLENVDFYWQHENKIIKKCR